MSGGQALRIVIHAIGSAGDVHPFIGIGVALQKRGHEVFLVTNPFYQDAVAAAGLGFRALGTAEDFRRITDDPDLWHPRRAFPAVIRLAVNPTHAPIHEITRELHRPGKTVVVASSLAFAARTSCELLHIPWATVHLAPSLFPTIHRQPEIHGMPFPDGAPEFLKRLQWWIAGKMVDYHALPELNRFRGSHGLAPARNLLKDWWNSPGRVIALFPSWFAPPQPDWLPQVVQTGFPLFDGGKGGPVPEGLEEFLADGTAPVIFTPGSAMSQGKAFFREAAAAVEISGCRALFLTPFRECLPDVLPAGTAHFPYVPFSTILPRAAVLVYHGGIGTCAQALRAGIPHLVQAMAHDQLDTLSRVRDLGVGLGLAPDVFTASNIARCLRRLLTEEGFRQRANEVAGRFDAELWMEETCGWIEKLAEEKNR